RGVVQLNPSVRFMRSGAPVSRVTLARNSAPLGASLKRRAAMQVTSARFAIVRFWIIALAVALLAMVTILSARADDPPAESEQTPAAEQSAAEAAPAANA